MGFGWPRYVPAGEKRRQAAREMKKLAAGGTEVQPVRIEGRAIARTFWGKAWCEHLESFGDYENRLPRGRTYVRNGSVCHLEVLSGGLKARVSGSELYTVAIDIKPLSGKAWKGIKERCTGRIASILDLLQGRLSEGVMAVVTDREKGLFPRPGEIAMRCSCPDWAVMCKHVAAVLYGVGARLDERPELLFLLRGVNHEELINARAEAAVEAVLKGGKRRRIAESELAEVFGVEIEEAAAGEGHPPAPPGGARAPRPATKRKRRSASTPAPFPARPTGADVKGLRERLGLSRQEFARLLGVSAGSVSLWEKVRSPLRLHGHSRRALEEAWTRSPRSSSGTQTR
jgi:uncharacterized Zn finger protein/DNA-binding transcriptional regulator YiaG